MSSVCGRPLPSGRNAARLADLIRVPSSWGSYLTEILVSTSLERFGTLPSCPLKFTPEVGAPNALEASKRLPKQCLEHVGWDTMDFTSARRPTRSHQGFQSLSCRSILHKCTCPNSHLFKSCWSSACARASFRRYCESRLWVSRCAD